MELYSTSLVKCRMRKYAENRDFVGGQSLRFVFFSAVTLSAYYNIRATKYSKEILYSDNIDYLLPFTRLTSEFFHR